MAQAMRVYRSSLAMLLACGLLMQGAEGVRRQEVKGQIIAFRPAESAFQAPSFVQNRESFLVKIAGSRNQVVRLMYEHFGYSDLKGELLSQTPSLVLRVERNK